MNRPHDPKSEDDRVAPTIEPAVIRALDDWQQQLDPVQRSRLGAARRRALAERRDAASPRRYGWLAPALAAGVLMAVGIGFWPQTATPPDAPVLDELVAADPADPLLDEDAEYLLWLASNDDAA